MATNRLDKIKRLERQRSELVQSLTYAQVLLNLLSVEDELMKNTWLDRGRTCAQWSDEAESHINAMIDILLSRA